MEFKIQNLEFKINIEIATLFARARNDGGVNAPRHEAYLKWVLRFTPPSRPTL